MAELDTIAARVALVRDCSGLAARALSELAGLAESHVGGIERGKIKDPGVSTVCALGRVTGVRVGWLAAGEGRPPSARRIRAAVLKAGGSAT